MGSDTPRRHNRATTDPRPMGDAPMTPAPAPHPPDSRAGHGQKDVAATGATTRGTGPATAGRRPMPTQPQLSGTQG